MSVESELDIRCIDIYVDFFFFNDTATTEIYTLSLHDALPICSGPPPACPRRPRRGTSSAPSTSPRAACTCFRARPPRSEEHTSELQSRQYLVCRLLLEKKKKQQNSSCPSIHDLYHLRDRTV